MSEELEKKPENLDEIPDLIRCLDKGFVRLVDKMGTDASIVRAARVSYGDGTKSVSEDRGLIRYLYRHEHGTPFEMTALQFHVRAPIFDFRQWHRHRIGCCISGEALIDFVDINGMRAPKICKTLEHLWQHWEYGEVNGHATDTERLSEALELISNGISVRKASSKTGIARGTLDRHRRRLVLADPTKRGGRWRLQDMRLRVLDESSGQFTHSRILEVIQSGEKELIRLSTDKHTLKLTPEHEVWTPSGWKAAGSLRKGDLVCRVGKVAVNERGIPPRLREGIGLWTQSLRPKLIKSVDTCYICQREFSYEDLELDHIVPVVGDLTKALVESNLSACCKECHKFKTNNEQQLATRGTRLGTVFIPLIDDPVPCGKEMTYDLYVEGHHNFVANGLVVHNSINEMSGRYSILPNDFFLPPAEALRLQSMSNKQGSEGVLSGEEAFALIEEISAQYESCYRIYEKQLQAGVAREIARAVLPVSLYSEMYWQCNIRSLFAFAILRSDSHAQEEIRVYSDAMLELASRYFPICVEAFKEYGLGRLVLYPRDIKAFQAMLNGLAYRDVIDGWKEFWPSKREMTEFVAKVEILCGNFLRSPEMPWNFEWGGSNVPSAM